MGWIREVQEDTNARFWFRFGSASHKNRKKNILVAYEAKLDRNEQLYALIV